MPYPAPARALYSYSSEHDDDLNFKNGQLITVTAEEDEEWFHGEYKDSLGTLHTGIFPKSFVEFITHESSSKSRTTTVSSAADSVPGNETSSSAAAEADLESEAGPDSKDAQASIPEVVAQKSPKEHSESAPLSFRDRIAAFNKVASQPPSQVSKKWTPTKTLPDSKPEHPVPVTSLRERIAALQTTRFEPVPKTKPAPPEETHDTPSPISTQRTLEDTEEKEEEFVREEVQDEIDPEQAKRQAIRERMAKMSGGMGMALALGMSPTPQKSKPKPPPDTPASPIPIESPNLHDIEPEPLNHSTPNQVESPDISCPIQDAAEQTTESKSPTIPTQEVTAITDTEAEGYEADEDTDVPRPSSSQKDTSLTIVTEGLQSNVPTSPPPRPPPELSSPSRDRPPVPRTSIEKSPPIRASIDSRLGSRISVDWSRPEHGYLAKDVQLQETEWWTLEKTPPPVYQGRSDILFEMDESITPRRGGRSQISKELYVLYPDYSQTIITAHFESDSPSQVALSQRHKPPPPTPSRQELVETADKFNKQILDFVTPQVGSVVGDGTNDDLVLQAVKHIPAALPPIGRISYGALIYTNLANCSVQQSDEIRPGDIVSFRNAKFQGHKGGLHSKYTIELAFHVGVVSSEWDGAKRKLRVYEQGREGKKLDEKTYRLNDFRSGELQVWRVRDRSSVEW